MSLTEPRDLDEILGEDTDALDFAAEPEPLADDEARTRRARALRHLTRRLAAVDAQQARERSELAAQHEEARRSLVERVGWLERSLQLTHRAIWLDDPQRTTVDLGCGVQLRSRAGTVEWVAPDEGTPEYDQTVAWLTEHLPGAVRTPEPPAPKIDRNALKAATKAATLAKRNGDTVPATEDGSVITADGEVVPGVRVVAKERTFTPEVSA